MLESVCNLRNVKLGLKAVLVMMGLFRRTLNLYNFFSCG